MTSGPEVFPGLRLGNCSIRSKEKKERKRMKGMTEEKRIGKEEKRIGKEEKRRVRTGKKEKRIGKEEKGEDE